MGERQCGQQADAKSRGSDQVPVCACHDQRL